jgi:DNA-binding CsgD family transcriptional regulator
MREGATKRLSAGQKEALRLVLRGYGAKEIARLLATSPGAINERLREARRTLEVSSSREAARLLAADEQGADYNSFVATPLGVADGEKAATLPPLINSGSVGSGTASVTLQEAQAGFEAAGSEGRSGFPWPIPIKGRPRNDLTVRQTILIVVALTIGLGMAALVAVALVDQLTRLKLG